MPLLLCHERFNEASLPDFADIRTDTAPKEHKESLEDLDRHAVHGWSTLSREMQGVARSFNFLLVHSTEKLFKLFPGRGSHILILEATRDVYAIIHRKYLLAIRTNHAPYEGMTCVVNKLQQEKIIMGAVMD